MNMETWNERLAAMLAEKNLPMSHLAAKVDVSEATVAAWVGSANMKPSQDLRSRPMLRVCDGLGICPEWLMLGHPPKYLKDRWPFTTPVYVLARMPDQELERIDQFIAKTLTIWREFYAGADAKDG
jgi:DNA-binding Xre family transcriptional regulator